MEKVKIHIVSVHRWKSLHMSVSDSAEICHKPHSEMATRPGG